MRPWDALVHNAANGQSVHSFPKLAARFAAVNPKVCSPS